VYKNDVKRHDYYELKLGKDMESGILSFSVISQLLPGRINRNLFYRSKGLAE